jgi:ketosteroid isomerase-like protein
MSASVVKAFHDAMKSMDTAALVASLADDLVVVEPPSLPYGGTTTSRDDFFGKVVGYTELRASFRVETAEVFGDGPRLAGHFTATFTADGSRETILLSPLETPSGWSS